jgi:autotransporter-associated beta strand protein
MRVVERRAVVLVAACSMSLLVATASRAAVREWSGDFFGNGLWTSPDSWFNAPPANNLTSDTAAFFGYFGGPVFMPNVNQPRSVRGVQFVPPDPGNPQPAFTFTGNTLTLGDVGVDVLAGAGSGHAINNNLVLGADQAWSIATNLNVMGDVSGGFQLQKSGGGTLRLQGAGSWTGGTVVRQGTLQIADGSALPDTGVLSFLQDTNVARRLDLEDDEIIGGLSSPADVTQVTVDLNTATLFINGPGDFASGVITGGASGRLAKSGSGALTIRTSNTYTGGTTVSGGELILAAAMGTPLGTGDLLIDAARASGAGNIPGDVTVDDGGTLAGTFNLGSLELIDDGRIELEWLTNTLTVGGVSDIGAGTLRVFADAPINPAIGTTWSFLTSTGGVDGMFVNPMLPPLPTGKSWRVLYEDTSVALQVVPTQLPGDYNDDLVVNAADYTVWRNSVGQTGPNLPADGTGPAGVPDGVVNRLDFFFWKQHYGETVGTGSLSPIGGSAPVPEPTATILLAPVVLCGLRFRRRRLRFRA